MISMSGVIQPLENGKKWKVPYTEDGVDKEMVFGSATEAVDWMMSIMRPTFEAQYREVSKLTGKVTEL